MGISISNATSSAITKYSVSLRSGEMCIRDRIKDALINIIGHNRTSGDLGIPDFTSEFQFSNGAFSVADSGFTVDMAALDRRLTPQPHDNMYSDMYEYSFRKVL